MSYYIIYLMHRWHANRIDTENFQHFHFGHRFIVGSAQTCVHTLMNVLFNAQLFGHLHTELGHPLIVRLVHGRKTRSEARVVRSLQRIIAGKAHDVDVILNDDNVANIVFGIDATGRICCNQMCASNQFHYTDWHRTLDNKNYFQLICFGIRVKKNLTQNSPWPMDSLRSSGNGLAYTWRVRCPNGRKSFCPHVLRRCWRESRECLRRITHRIRWVDRPTNRDRIRKWWQSLVEWPYGPAGSWQCLVAFRMCTYIRAWK